MASSIISQYTIFDLPNELLNEIAAYLDVESKLRFGWTCSLFQSIIRNPVLWYEFRWVSNGEYSNFCHVELALEINKMAVKKLSLTCYSEKDPILPRIFPVIHSCQYLRSLTLTNFYFEQRYLLPLLDGMPTLSELHIHSLSRTMIQIPPLLDRSNLKVLSIYEKHSFKTWAKSLYFPSDVRVILPDMLSLRVHSMAEYLDKDVIDNHHKPGDKIFQKEACLTFYQPLLKYVSLPYVPIAQIYFTPPDMEPTVHRFPRGGDMYELVMIEDGVGSNIISGAASFPRQHFNELTLSVPSTTLTSVTLYNESNFTGNDLEIIAYICPNLIHLDISFSDGCLEDLCGLKEVAVSCTKLESLNMDARNDRRPINHDALWDVIRTMENLKVLKVSIYLIPSTLGDNGMPSLQALYLLYRRGLFLLRFDDTYFEFFNNLPSLRYFRLDSLPQGDINIGLYNCLNTFTNLTHLYIDKITGGNLTLPLIATCYRKLENLYLHCDNFIFSDTLATTISRCKKLKILALKVESVSVAAIRTMFYGLPLLVIYFVLTTVQQEFGNRRTFDDLEMDLSHHGKSQGRMINLKIVRGSTVDLFDQTEEHLFNQ